MFKLIKKDDLTFLQSDVFQGKLKHCFSTRINKNEKSFSMKNNEKNQKILCNKLCFNFKNLLIPEQTHSDNIAIIKTFENNNLSNTDGVITNLKNTPIMLLFADCVPVIIYDENKQVLGVIHAGWKGTAKKITAKAIKIFIEEFGSSKEDLKVSIGASISQENYEIDNNTAKQLQSSLIKEYDDVFIQTDNGKYFADLKKLNYYQSREMGIEKIDISNHCTYSSTDLFFSYRRDKEAGRHAAVAQLD